VKTIKAAIFALALAVLQNAVLVCAQELENTAAGLVTMNFSDLDFREFIRLCADQAGTDALVEKSVRKKVSVSCENEPGAGLLARVAADQKLLSCAVGEVVVYYAMPFNAFRRYNGPDDYTDFLPKAAHEYRQRLSAAEGLRIDVRADDRDIREILRELAAQAGAEYRESHPVRGHIWVNLSDVPLSDAFAAIVIANGYGLRVEDGAWVIGRAESFADQD